MAVLKYEKPMILLVDLPEDALMRLQAAGLNLTAGGVIRKAVSVGGRSTQLRACHPQFLLA